MANETTKVEWIPTTEQVYFKIVREHEDTLKVFETISMEEHWLTIWGFENADYPILKYERRGPSGPNKGKYYIAVIKDRSEEEIHANSTY